MEFSLLFMHNTIFLIYCACVCIRYPLQRSEMAKNFKSLSLLILTSESYTPNWLKLNQNCIFFSSKISNTWEILEILKKLHQAGIELTLPENIYKNKYSQNISSSPFLILGSSKVKERALYSVNISTQNSYFFAGLEIYTLDFCLKMLSSTLM